MLYGKLRQTAQWSDVLPILCTKPMETENHCMRKDGESLRATRGEEGAVHQPLCILIGKVDSKIFLILQTSAEGKLVRWQLACSPVWKIFKADIANLHLTTYLALVHTDYRPARRQCEKSLLRSVPCPRFLSYTVNPEYPFSSSNGRITEKTILTF